MKVLEAFCFTIVLAVAASIASAANYEKAVVGAGSISCGKYLSQNDSKHLAINISWVQGYLSGLNMAGDAIGNMNPIELPDAAAIKTYLDKYCHDDPLDSLLSGAVTLHGELRNRQSH